MKYREQDLISYANSNKIVILQPEADTCWNTHTNSGAKPKTELYDKHHDAYNGKYWATNKGLQPMAVMKMI